MKNFNELTKNWSPERRERVKKMAKRMIDDWPKEERDEIDLELKAAAAYAERTGKNFYELSLVGQRKEFENYKEDHEK